MSALILLTSLGQQLLVVQHLENLKGHSKHFQIVYILNFLLSSASFSHLNLFVAGNMYQKANKILVTEIIHCLFSHIIFGPLSIHVEATLGLSAALKSLYQLMFKISFFISLGQEELYIVVHPAFRPRSLPFLIDFQLKALHSFEDNRLYSRHENVAKEQGGTASVLHHSRLSCIPSSHQRPSTSFSSLLLLLLPQDPQIQSK